MVKQRSLVKAWYWLRGESGALSARYFSEESNIVLGEAKVVGRILLPEEQKELLSGIHQIQRELKRKPTGYEEHIIKKIGVLFALIKSTKI